MRIIFQVPKQAIYRRAGQKSSGIQAISSLDSSLYSDNNPIIPGLKRPQIGREAKQANQQSSFFLPSFCSPVPSPGFHYTNQYFSQFPVRFLRRQISVGRLSRKKEEREKTSTIIRLIIIPDGSHLIFRSIWIISLMLDPFSLCSSIP